MRLRHICTDISDICIGKAYILGFIRSYKTVRGRNEDLKVLLSDYDVYLFRLAELSTPMTVE
jgi:hypothetical protein